MPKRRISKIDNVYDKIINILETARRKTYHAVNSAMVEAYWNIGKVIVEEEQKGRKRAEYGAYLLRSLSEQLSKDYGRGFDERNLRNMRSFFQAFPIRNALRSELSWTHYRLLLKVEKEQSMQFYLVDNASTDRSVEFVRENYPEFKIIQNKENLGTAQGSNVAVGEAKGKYIFWVSNDMEFDSHIVNHLVSRCESDEKSREG